MNRKMLIVDDDEAIQLAFGEYFRTVGWIVDAATEWEEAEALLTARTFDVMLVDLQLTNFCGGEGLEILQFAEHECPETTVILMTGQGGPEVEREAFRRGASAFLDKPQSPEKVAELVLGLIKTHPRPADPTSFESSLPDR